MSEQAERIGAYEVVRLIAHGGMATVYEARQPALDRAVALKRLDLRSNDPTLAARFIRESHIAASFDHPNIVTVFDFFEWRAVPYIAMEYLPRGSLRPLIRHLTLPQTFGVLEGVLAALAHAEQFGVAHRDLKPENVLITRRGAVKIADFGIAKAYTASTRGFTETGTAVGTPAYMAPEQALGQQVGPYTDLYAAGVMAYEMLSGAPPFAGTDTPMAVMFRHVNEIPPRLEGVDERLADWVSRLLEKAPDARFAGAALAWQELEDVVVDLLGPYWRRNSMLADAATSAPTPLLEPLPPPETPQEETPDSTWRTYESPPPLSDIDPAEFVTTDPSSWAGPPEAGGGAGGDGRVPQGTGADPVEPPSRALTVPPAKRRDEPERPVARTLVSRVGERAAGPRTQHRGSGRARRALLAAVGVAVLGGGVAAALLLNPDPPAPGPDATATATATAVPGVPSRGFDFDGDGYPTVVAGLPGWRAPGGGNRSAGAVALPAADRLIAGSELSPPVVGRFGSAMASGDFDRDGHAELAIGAPRADADDGAGREGAVTVIPGSRRGLVPAQARTRQGPGVPGPFRAAQYGATLAAGDLDGDRFADLIVGVPGARSTRDRPGSGALQLVFGGPGGLNDERTRVIRRPNGTMDGFGSLLRIADVNGDDDLDLVEASPGDPENGIPGHVSFCRGRSAGPFNCRPLEGIVTSGPVSLGLGDLTGDKLPDVVAGVPAAEGGAGAVLVWIGRPGGPRGLPLTITQESPGVLGNAQSEDRFGASVAVARVDGDRDADLVVGAPGEDGGRGRVTLLLGGPDGYDPAGVQLHGSAYAALPVDDWDGARFGDTVTVVDEDGDGRASLYVAVPGTGQIITLPNTGTGFTAEGATAEDVTALQGEGELPPGSTIWLR